MKLSLIQMRVTADKAENLRTAAEAVSDAAGRGAELVMLPEMFCCPYENAAFPRCAEPRGGAIYTALREMARENRVILIGGSFPEREDGRIYNTSFVFAPDGAELARHRKAHLFDIDIPGGQRFLESETLSPGEGGTVFDTAFGRFGLCICFDLRFPALARELAEAGARAIFVPAAFNRTTGPLHWELLFRARAVDQELFTVGCSPARDETASYVAYGHSLVVDPWGRVLAEAGAGAESLDAELDLAEVTAMRRQVPVLPEALRG